MKSPLFSLFCFFICCSNALNAQTCTISCSGASPCGINWSSLSCDETSSNPVAGDEIIVTDGVTLLVDGTYSFDGSIRIKNGGRLDFDGPSDRIDLGTNTTGCNRYVAIEDGGQISGTSSSNRLSICGVLVGKGGTGGCDNTEPIADATPPEFCMGGDGINGEVGLTEFGADYSVLPVELVFFKGNLNQSKIDLQWQTASEIDFDFFEILHSDDGYDFETVGKLKGKGGEKALTNYAFSHYQLVPGNNYYMLGIVNLDKAKDFSSVISIYNQDYQVEVYPTLNSISGNVNIVLPFHDYKFLNIKYSDSLGEEISLTKYGKHSGGFLSVSPSNALLPNIYFIEIQTDRFTYRSKLVVIR